MIFRKKINYELWGSCYPKSCSSDKAGCKYYVVDREKEESYGFDDWKEAEKFYCEKTKSDPFTCSNLST